MPLVGASGTGCPATAPLGDRAGPGAALIGGVLIGA